MIDSCEEGWVERVVAFVDKFYRRERRTAVRIEALNYLGTAVTENSLTHEVIARLSAENYLKNSLLKFLFSCNMADA
jgi:hypothetical protein